MAENPLLEHFRALPDPRVDRTKRHLLEDILAIAILATVAGCNSFPQIHAYARAKEEWLKSFLALPHGIPCEHTFRRVFAALDPEAFHRCFAGWVRTVTQTLKEVVAVDGKTSRGTFDTARGTSPLHTVSAWAAETHLVLGQVKTAEGSNEITAVPELLALLDLAGCLVTMDAMGCQVAIAQAILDREADYLLTVKGNQETLEQDVREEFQAAQEDDFRHLEHTYHKTVDKGHGRVEVRECWHTPEVSGLDPQGRWPGLCGMAMCRHTRTLHGEIRIETRYYITSRIDLDAAGALEAVRSHWGIENRLHWVLDTAFLDDASRIRTDHGPENLETVRHWALNLVRGDKGTKGSIQTKRLKAGWNNEYLKQLMTATHY